MSSKKHEDATKDPKAEVTPAQAEHKAKKEPGSNQFESQRNADEQSKKTAHEAKAHEQKAHEHKAHEHDQPNGHDHAPFENLEQLIKDVKKEAKAFAKDESKKGHDEAQKAIKVMADLKATIADLRHKVSDLEQEKARDLASFQDKASSFQTKAQDEINKFKEALSAKFSDDKVEQSKYALQRLMEHLAEPLLNFDLAITSGAAQEGETGAYVKGFAMLLEQVNSALAASGIKLITPQVGAAYDVNLHYALGREVSEAHPVDTILKVIKKGYMLHQRVIKPATVIISSKTN